MKKGFLRYIESSFLLTLFIGATLSVVEFRVTEAVIPSVELFFHAKSYSDGWQKPLLLSQAVYGPDPPIKSGGQGDDQKALVSSPANNFFLCQNSDGLEIDSDVSESTKDAWMVVPRGGCTYEQKTWIAQSIYGADGIIVYNNLGSRYSFNETDSAIVWPLEHHDYDCDNAQAEIPSNELNFFSNIDEANAANGVGAGPYDFKTNDQVLTSDTVDNLCKIHDANNLLNCPSKRCLVAHDRKSSVTQVTSDTLSVCCAWDILLNPYIDENLDQNVTIEIPTLFASMEQWDVISEVMETFPSVTVAVYSRWRPKFDLSPVLIVILGVLVAALAAYLSANDYHIGISKLWQSKKNDLTGYNAVQRNASSGNEQQGMLVPKNNASVGEETLELEPIHALLFLVMSSISLFVLFFFKIYNVAKVMYAFGCSNAFIQIMVDPTLSKVLRLLHSKFPRLRTSCFAERTLYQSEDFGAISNWYILSCVIGYGTGLVWLFMALFVPQAGEKFAFYWITQDILGYCMCVFFLGIIQLNSIQVASVLLVVAFFYDIFFVFITPHIFKGRSVMIEVATSGGPPKADALWCEKYPLDPDCIGGDPMPMLFSIPRLLDYRGGASMLGLGDIVLPGLLLSFAARLDAARLVCELYHATKNKASNAGLPPVMSTWYALLFGGYGYYFVPMIVAYAIGLFMANAAVHLMEMGQPALLYLVPCTLGTMIYKGLKRNELTSIWNGPKILRQADHICFGSSVPHADGSGEGDNSVSVRTDANNEFLDRGEGDVVPLMSMTEEFSGEREKSDSE
eukprot:CAMPEP_0197185936 /NCGR_PEP_ID=MMETSP1423-20130617/12920_1 /TAXON_ID=476441 /ORGANISM="Pseudo-nitzschia heimii, Strain UNC1101" /LENGTH=792 /DNA_ID=CAMNT_0042637117 /DNA_START=104 /DNA_END=2482 /DNA_ORIENTATION=+